MKYFFGVCIATLVFSTHSVFAHGTGASLEATSTVYLIDIGYDPVEFVAGSPSRFEFNLSKDGDKVDYESVWVRIVENKKTKLATGISHDNFGKTTLLYDFARQGMYTLEASYRDASGEIAKSSFSIPVLPPDDASKGTAFFVAATVVGIILFPVALFLFVRRGRS